MSSGYLAGQILAALTLGVERAGWWHWPWIGAKATGMLKRARGLIGRHRSLPSRCLQHWDNDTYQYHPISQTDSGGYKIPAICLVQIEYICPVKGNEIQLPRILFTGHKKHTVNLAGLIRTVALLEPQNLSLQYFMIHPVYVKLTCLKESHRMAPHLRHQLTTPSIISIPLFPMTFSWYFQDLWCAISISVGNRSHPTVSCKKLL